MNDAHRDLRPALLHGQHATREVLGPLRQQHEVAAPVVRFLASGLVELQKIVERQALHSFVGVEENAVLRRGLDGGLQFWRVLREFFELLAIAECLGVENGDIESRAELAEEIDQVLHLLRHLLLGGSGEGVAIVGKCAEYLVLLKNYDGGRAFGEQRAQPLREIGRESELFVAREIIPDMVTIFE